MRYMKKAGVVMTCAVVAIWAVAACAGIQVYGPCAVPKELTRNDLIGEWQLNYTDFITDPSKVVLTGVETVTLERDGTYAHSFDSEDYIYADAGMEWEWITDTPDSPKLKMHGMKYFADGPDRANTQKLFELSPQMSDIFRIQDYNEKKSGKQWVSPGVTYPIEGYIYLYPRLCNGVLSLVQMMDPRQDPDDMTVQNPVFTRQ